MKELGLFGATISPEYGGLGLSAWTYAQIVIKVASIWMAPSGIFNSHLIVAAAIERHGTDEQKRTTCRDGQGRAARQHRPDRAERRLRPAGHPHDGACWKVTSTSSTAARCGSRTACTGTSRCCW
jgi:hypothetical protein